VDCRRRLTDIVDGTDKTILVTEAAGRPDRWRTGMSRLGGRSPGGGWADPESLLHLLGTDAGGTVTPGPCAINCANHDIYSFHSGGANAVFADGSVRFVSQSISIATLAALVTPAGGEIINGTDF
jgi:prepilin-type processing-associated H-X9-DG protein